MYTMKLGPRGETLIKSFETLSLKAYLPTPEDKPTIGWGHTMHVKMGDAIDLEMAQDFFRLDIRWAERAVMETHAVLTQSMFDALVSLVFNCGLGCISPGTTIGTALRTVVKGGYASYYFDVWAGFALWRKQGKRDLLGLARRRAQEMQLFLADGLP